MSDSVRIDGGTTLVAAGLYEYRYTTVDGEVVIHFTASQTPKIGDLIDEGVLVPLLGPLINQDNSRWIKHQEETWPKRDF